jgi:hypothetical protein
VGRGQGIVTALAGLAVIAGFSLWLVDAPIEPTQQQQLALTPQECVTECQSRQTDCVLNCEGRDPCQQRCTPAAEVCVKACVKDPSVKDPSVKDPSDAGRD